VVGHQHRVSLCPPCGGKEWRDIGGDVDGGHPHCHDSHAELCRGPFDLGVRIEARVGDEGWPRQHLFQDFQQLVVIRWNGESGEVPTRAGDARHEPAFHGIVPDREHDRNGPGRRPGRARRPDSKHEDEIDLLARQVVGERDHLWPILGEPRDDLDIATLDPAELGHRLPEFRRQSGRPSSQKADPPLLFRLRCAAGDRCDPAANRNRSQE
jgi:hypothetical protein